MKFEFDPKKNAANQKKHNLAFEDVPLLDWPQALIAVDDRTDYGEERAAALVPDDAGRLHVVCYTVRDDVLRAISFRKANNREQRRWQENQQSN